MAIKPDWTLGTLTLIAGSAAFTTTGSALKSADIQGGDTLITQSGLVLVIATITGENSGTLYMPCPSVAAGFDQPLRVRYQADGSRLPAATRHLINELSSGNLYAFSQLLGGVDKVPYFTGAGVMDLIDLSSLGGGGTGGGSWDALTGTLAGRDAFNGEAAGFRVLIANNGNGQAVIYQKTGVGTGEWSAPVLFTGPKGNDGPPNKLEVGSVTVGAQAYVSVTGTPPNQVVNFVLPRGEKGETGDVTPQLLAAKEAAEEAAIQARGDVEATERNLIATTADRAATKADREGTALDLFTTSQNRTQTGLDRTATGADRTQTGLDAIATAQSAQKAAAATLIGYGVSIYKADGIVAGGYYCERRANAASKQTNIYAEIIDGDAGSEVTVTMFVGGSAVHAPFRVVKGGPVSLSGLNIAVDASSDIRFFVTPTPEKVRELFIKSYGAVS